MAFMWYGMSFSNIRGIVEGGDSEMAVTPASNIPGTMKTNRENSGVLISALYAVASILTSLNCATRN